MAFRFLAMGTGASWRVQGSSNWLKKLITKPTKEEFSPTKTRRNLNHADKLRLVPTRHALSFVFRHEDCTTARKRVKTTSIIRTQCEQSSAGILPVQATFGRQLGISVAAAAVAATAVVSFPVAVH